LTLDVQQKVNKNRKKTRKNTSLSAAHAADAGDDAKYQFCVAVKQSMMTHAVTLIR